MTVLLVVAGAAVGAPLRYLADRFISARHRSDFPWGTLTVNVSGSLVLGLLSGLLLAPDAQALLGIGFCGAFTTYSTFAFETVRLIERRSVALSALYVAVSLIAGLAAALIGLAVGTILT